MDVVWVVLAVVMAAACVRGMRFRRGTDRSFVAWYRNVKRPAVWRHIPLIAPYSFGYVFALIVIGAIRVAFGPSQASLALDILWASLAAVSFMLAFALSIWRMYSPPPWLTPSWLVDDDQRVGYVRPKPGWEDRGWLVIAFGFAAMALVTIAYVGSIVLSRPEGQNTTAEDRINRGPAREFFLVGAALDLYGNWIEAARKDRPFLMNGIRTLMHTGLKAGAGGVGTFVGGIGGGAVGFIVEPAGGGFVGGALGGLYGADRGADWGDRLYIQLFGL